MSSDSLFQECASCKKMLPKSIKKCPNCGFKIKKITFIQWIIIFFLFLFLIIVLKSPDKENLQINNSANVPTTLNLSKKEVVVRNLELNYNWRKSRFGSVMKIDFTLKNTSDYDIKDVEIFCEHQAGSKTKIDSNSKVVYEIFKAKSNRKLNGFNMGFIHSQAQYTSCFIKNFVVI
jgi:hypothetical protein